MKTYGYVVLAIAVAGIGAAVAAERNDDETKASALGASFPLASAIAEAERAASGKATEADVDDEGATPAWEVEVISASGSKTVLVDMSSGQILKVSDSDEDKADRDEDTD